MACFLCDKGSREYWESVVNDFFVPHAIFNFKLHDSDPKNFGAWSEAAQNSHTTGSKSDNKNIDVTVPVFARFFLL